MLSFPEILASVTSTAILFSLGFYSFLVSSVRDDLLAREVISEVLYSCSNWQLMSWKRRAFFASAAIGLLICIYQGMYTMLFWIPVHWEHSEDGTYGEARSYLAGLGALIVGPLLIGALDSVTRLKFERRLAKIASIALENILSASRNKRELERLKNEYNDRINTLAEEIKMDPQKKHYKLTMRGQELVVLRKITWKIEELIQLLEKCHPSQ